MRTIQTMLALLSLNWLVACKHQDCQSPPPSYNFAFVDAQGQSIIQDSLQARALHLTLTSSAGMSTTISSADFKPILSNDQYKFLYHASYDLFAQVGPSQYTVRLTNQAVGDLTLISQRNDSECDGWMHLVSVLFKNQVVNPSGNDGTYVIEITR